MAETEHDRIRVFVERFALVLTEAGMPRMPARVFACVLSEDSGRLTAAELAERLGVSAAAVSGAVRYLVPVGMLHKGRAPGARVDHYELTGDVWYESLTERDSLLRRWEAVLEEGIAALEPDRPATARLRESRDFFAFVRSELPPMMERWRAQRDARR